MPTGVVDPDQEHAWSEVVFPSGQDRAELPTQAITPHGRAERTTDGKGHLRGRKGGIAKHDAPQEATANTRSLAAEALKLVGAVEASDQADSR